MESGISFCFDLDFPNDAERLSMCFLAIYISFLEKEIIKIGAEFIEIKKQTKAKNNEDKNCFLKRLRDLANL